MPTLYTYDDPALGYNETCFFYEGDYDPNCGGTNFYDDPALGYDERCYFYNGPDYDQLCLVEPVPVVVTKNLIGGYTPARRKDQPKHLPWIKVTIEAELCEVNSEMFLMIPEELRFEGENPDITIQVNGAQFDTRFPTIRGEMVVSPLDKVSAFATLVEVQVPGSELIEETYFVNSSKDEPTVKVELQSKNKEALVEITAILIKSGTNKDD